MTTAKPKAITTGRIRSVHIDTGSSRTDRPFFLLGPERAHRLGSQPMVEMKTRLAANSSRRGHVPHGIDSKHPGLRC